MIGTLLTVAALLVAVALIASGILLSMLVQAPFANGGDSGGSE